MLQKNCYATLGIAIVVGALAAATIMASNWLFGGRAILTPLEPDDIAVTLAIGLILGPLVFGPRKLITVLNGLFIANFVYLALVIAVFLAFQAWFDSYSFRVDMFERVAVHAGMISIGVWLTSLCRRHQSVAPGNG
jgi:hypothetical protein